MIIVVVQRLILCYHAYYVAILRFCHNMPAVPLYVGLFAAAVTVSLQWD